MKYLSLIKRHYETTCNHLPIFVRTQDRRETGKVRLVCFSPVFLSPETSSTCSTSLISRSRWYRYRSPHDCCNLVSTMLLRCFLSYPSRNVPLDSAGQPVKISAIRMRKLGRLTIEPCLILSGAAINLTYLSFYNSCMSITRVPGSRR